MDSPVYNQEGKEIGKVNLPETIFGAPWKPALVHQVVTAMRGNARQSLAHVKTRGEVRGGGRKPWQQKGTGRARHGSTRSPIWVGGGVTHGPRKEKSYEKKINRKMSVGALFSLLSRKLSDKEIIFADFTGKTPSKTKEAISFLKNLAEKANAKKIDYISGRRAMILLPTKDRKFMASFKNIKSVSVEEIRNLNPLSAATYKYLVFVGSEQTLQTLESRGKILV